MPWVAVAAALAAGGYLVSKLTDAGTRAGVLAPESQTNTPPAPGTIGQAADRLSGAASVGLLLVAGAFAYKVSR